MKNIIEQTQEIWWHLTRINAKKTIPQYIIIKLLKTKNEAKILKSVRGKQHITKRESQFEWSQIKQWGAENSGKIFLKWEEKKWSIHNTLCRDNSLQKWRRSKGILRWNKTQACRLPLEEASRVGRGMMSEGNWELQNEGKNTETVNK